MKSLLLAGIALHSALATEAGSAVAQAAAEGLVPRSADEPGQKTPAQAKDDAAKAPRMPDAPKAKTGKVVKSKHKPSAVVATDTNPQKSIVPVRFKQRYAETGDSCGDRVALALAKFTEGKNEDGRPCCDETKLQEVAAANGIDYKAYFRCNVGQKRMNIGNRLRGMVKNEKPVVIGKQRFADWEKAKVVDKSAWAKPEPKAKKAEAHAAA